MSNRISENERRIIYLSVFVVIILTILFGLYNDQTYSIIAALLIVIVAIGNIVYIYGRMRRARLGEEGGSGLTPEGYFIHHAKRLQGLIDPLD